MCASYDSPTDSYSQPQPQPRRLESFCVSCLIDLTVTRPTAARYRANAFSFPPRTVTHKLTCFYYPRDAMLARVLAVAMCLSVCLSVTSRCSVKREEGINLVFGMEASFDHSCTVF